LSISVDHIGAVETADETTVEDTKHSPFFYFLADFLFDKAHPEMI
jgi:hypothetical protein